MINLTFVIPGGLPGAPPPEAYKEATRRFAETYRKFPADADHRLWLVNSNEGLTPEIAGYFDGIDYEVIDYRGSGWDIGAHLYAALTMDRNDWIMCFSSRSHFRRRGWLKAFVEARERFGDGLYGSMSSFERLPHIRSTGFFVRCERLHRYPHGCNSREEAFAFESGPDSLSQWCLRQGYGVWLVTPEAAVPLSDSRQLNNVYRRGDQSNIWIYDWHTELFEEASPERKEIMSRGAENLRMPKPPAWQRRSRRIAALFRRLTTSNG